jgi:Zinc carboxypeptidase
MSFSRNLLTFVLIFITTKATMPLNFSDSLFEKYDSYLESSIKNRRFKHADIQPLIANLRTESQFAIEQIGTSFEGRAINMIRIGNGKTKVLLWSQMHGDEATATMAIFDIFNFFKNKDDIFTKEKQAILENCTLYFVPMLNPDGAERFTRRTSQGIDMNRDALRTQTPEGELLKKLQNTLQPEFAFNLHDQGVRYSAGNSPKQATISFLATAFDMERNWNTTRKRSMQVICRMSDALQKAIPGHIAKYSDEHEPRAFGDNIQKWGSSLMLIESGGYKNDVEKQYIRKLNFMAILTGIESISKQDYKKYKLADYEAIPNNEKYLFTLLIRRATFEQNGKTFVKDIGINRDEVNQNNATTFSIKSTIEDMGDLSTFWGIEEISVDGLRVKYFDEYPELAKQLNVEKISKNLSLDSPANFLLISKDGPAYAIVNGVLTKF